MSVLAALVAALLAASVPASAADTPAPGGAAQLEAPRLPAFEARTLDGKRLATTDFSGKRLLLFCFNPGVEQAGEYAAALAKLAPERTRYNFAIAGVAMGLDPAKAREFASRRKLDFPIFDDSGGEIAAQLGLQAPLVLIGTDPDGRVGLGLIGAEHENALSTSVIEARVRDFLRIPRPGTVADGKLDERPKAPAFEGKRMDGGAPIRLADFAGKPVIVTFFVAQCSHCQDALGFFKSELARIPEESRPALVGVTNDSRPFAVQSVLEEKKLDFFPILVDADGKVASSYNAFGAVPDIVLIDAAGRIAFRNKGWNATHDADLMRMRLASLRGGKVPMLLSRIGYSGNDACAVCHPSEHATWRYTEHAFAIDTLAVRGADNDPKCVGCHVVGFGDRGGYTLAGHEKHLENVGCETCHGMGGGHLPVEGKAAKATGFEAACAKCHDQVHSVGFNFATFLPKVSHAAMSLLSDAERAKRVANREQPRDLLSSAAPFVGSSACKSCHEKEHTIWSSSAHARSIESLEKKGKDDEAECVKCHVTGFNRPGGFPADGKVKAHEDLARVGCESCHGPGGEHVKEGGKRAGGILKLGDKCDSCVILQICGSCHDDANDPGFRFEVEQKIEVLRHGTPSGHSGP